MSVVCDTCGKPAVLVEDERTAHMGYACRDRSCDGYRRLQHRVSREAVESTRERP